MRIQRFVLWIVALSTLSIPVLPNAYAEATKAEKIDALLTEYYHLGLFNGVVLVAEQGEVIHRRGFGFADMSWDVRNTPNTKFRIGSVTKQFTAALILQLAEEGSIELEAPVRKYLPNYPKSKGERITLHHLLTHTSGLPSYTSFPNWTELSRDRYEPAEFVAMFSGLDLEFEPGTRFSYSNSGYFLLGVILERVTGRPYDELLEERLFGPLGMSDTSYGHYAEIVERRARGYTGTPEGYRRAAYIDTSTPYAAGMIVSTVDDLLRWSRALDRGEVFGKPETRALMFQPYVSTSEGGENLSYAYGWVIGEVAVGVRKVRIIQHGGGISGFSTRFRRMPEERNTIIIMDNTESRSLDAIRDGITNILYGESAQAPKIETLSGM